MASLTKQLIVCWMIVFLGKLPIPYLHTHEGMEEHRLVRHLQTHHGGCTLADCGLGWHVHFWWWQSERPTGVGWDSVPVQTELPPSLLPDLDDCSMSIEKLLHSQTTAHACPRQIFLVGASRSAKSCSYRDRLGGELQNVSCTRNRESQVATGGIHAGKRFDLQ